MKWKTKEQLQNGILFIKINIIIFLLFNSLHQSMFKYPELNDVKS